MTSCFHIMEAINPNQTRCVCFVQFARWRHRGGVCCLRLHLVRRGSAAGRRTWWWTDTSGKSRPLSRPISRAHSPPALTTLVACRRCPSAVSTAHPPDAVCVSAVTATPCLMTAPYRRAPAARACVSEYGSTWPSPGVYRPASTWSMFSSGWSRRISCGQMRRCNAFHQPHIVHIMTTPVTILGGIKQQQQPLCRSSC